MHNNKNIIIRPRKKSEMPLNLYGRCNYDDMVGLSLTKTHKILFLVLMINKKHMSHGAVSLTYLIILKKGFTPILSATLSYGKSVSP